MKLLIVDDEKLTREGIIASINFDELGISEIYEANDGIAGLEKAKTCPPDIVLCDIRMPRMNGIDMLDAITAIDPDIPFIMMSGYSDKEYLKAAIRLKAINYIEKPIVPAEMEDALKKAIEQRQYALRQRQAIEIHSNLAASSLALQMTIPYSRCKKELDELFAQFKQYYGDDKFKYVTTIIVRLEELNDAATDLTYVHHQIHDFLRPFHLHIIYGEKRDFHVVYHVYSSLEHTGSTITMVVKELSRLYREIGNFYIAVGDTVCGITKAYHSYEMAVIALQRSYFYEPGDILYTTHEETISVDIPTLTRLSEDYVSSIDAKDKSQTFSTLQVLYHSCHHACNLMPNQIKSIYYEMFSSLNKVRKANQLLPDFSIENHESIMDLIQECFSYHDLHSLLREKTNSFFEDLSSAVPENSTIYLIREYINQHYMNSALSVKDISEYVNLSVSYLCTFFKNSTEITLNQYITEFRLEKAKQLLADPRQRINDISSAVGYNDGNYFSKSFRKYTGMSPSEFREKALK